MLVLTRKVGEQIVVPQCQLTMSVLGIVGKRVRLGTAMPTGCRRPFDVLHKRSFRLLL